MNSATKNKYDASPSATGYLYQCRYALLEALRQVRTHPNIAISLEKFDDIAVAKGVVGREWIQLKHHGGQAGKLTDASTDLWSTLRIWSEKFALGQLVLPGTALWIVTTASAPQNSAASLLRLLERDSLRALKLLTEVARTSTNQENAPAYTAFRKLSKALRIELCNAIYVFDNASHVEDLPTLLEDALRLSTSREHLPSLVQRLEGWWFDRVVSHLTGARKTATTGEELIAVVNDLSDQFARDNLPIDPDLPAKPSVLSTEHAHRVLVAQLRLLHAPLSRILFALHDYLRATTQRSRWLREGLIHPGELRRYKDRLREEWARRFEIRMATLGPNATEDEKQVAGNRLYEQVIEDFKIHIRPRCDTPFVMRGTYHDLADSLFVGWHPDFDAQLRHLLGLGKKSA